MAETKRMHTVPEGYLEAFAVLEGRRTPAVWRYSRDRVEPDLIGIRDAAVWKHIYAFDTKDGRDTSIETLLTNVEGNFCAARKELQENKTLSPASRSSIARFIAFQYVRTPRSLQIFQDDYGNDRRERVLAMAADAEQFRHALGETFDSPEECEYARTELLKGGWYFKADSATGLICMLHCIPMLILPIALMDWTIHASDGTFLFLASDNPVTLYLERQVGGDIGAECGVGLASPNAVLNFPISSRVTLSARHNSHSLLALEAVRPEDFNRAQLLHARHKLHYEQASAGWIKRTNQINVANADRYVFHNERDKGWISSWPDTLSISQLPFVVATSALSGP